ncbi:[protein-PII] uridylyltransferase [Teredinibacter waterburyi]|uniref:[protein-PII] uridylyltransferase n=1 Tax=Teredinibacter waterburyi TaxID=1500538 RepID=UPI00165F59CF|nr:[protein-PII] uridylyltransferase [Teredinibacter waterburyi]
MQPAAISTKQLPYFPYQPIFFKQQRFREDLAVKPTIKVFKDAIFGVNEHFAQRFREGADVGSLIRERAAFVDVLLHYAWHQYDWNDDIALIAVGGYGRGELHPKSDIDILILLDNSISNEYNEQLQTLVTFLWDIGLEIGSSVRTLNECVAIAKDDITVATNLIEARRLAGNDTLRDQLQILTGPDHMWSVKDFFLAKRSEQEERHNKHNFTEYNLEPNIKNAPGGLRDIQTINWVAKRYFGVPSLTKLEGKGFFTELEYATLRNGEDYLWRVRYGVHLLSGRAEERLLFEYQRELAGLFGYHDTAEELAVEQFMHEYYRTVMALRELNDVLLQHLDELIHTQHSALEIIAINDRFQLCDNYIEVTQPSVFDETPSALLEIFIIMGNNPTISGVRASTIRLIRERRWLVDESFRANPANRAMFLELFLLETGLLQQLRRMARYGILGRYLPAWGTITGQMQHDLFHQYTVDAHTLLVIRNLRNFRKPEASENFPIAAHIMKRRTHLHLLYIAAMFHDIGKGRGGDHSTLGAQDAIDFCEEHGFRGKDTRLVAWLVEKHLLMSYVSQKQDISDPEVVHNFALEVGDQRHLDYLYALTVADMCGTNPEIWNSWRASLMRQLYMETKRALRRGLENTVDKQEYIEETQQLAEAKLIDKGISSETARAIWAEMGEEYFIRESHLDIAWHTESIAQYNHDPVILVRESTNLGVGGATQIFIRTKDDYRVFSVVSHCLAALNLNVQDARIYSSTNGYTIDTFFVLDENHEPLDDDPRRYKRIIDSITDELSEKDLSGSDIKRRTPRQLKQFSIPTRTSISNDINNHHTVVEVISPDRPGLLATIGEIFIEHDIHLQNAKISTLGERVEDVFFVTDMDGNPLGDPALCAALQADICSKLDKKVKSELTH